MFYWVLSYGTMMIRPGVGAGTQLKSCPLPSSLYQRW